MVIRPDPLNLATIATYFADQSPVASCYAVRLFVVGIDRSSWKGALSARQGSEYYFSLAKAKSQAETVYSKQGSHLSILEVPALALSAGSKTLLHGPIDAHEHPVLFTSYQQVPAHLGAAFRHFAEPVNTITRRTFLTDEAVFRLRDSLKWHERFPRRGRDATCWDQGEIPFDLSPISAYINNLSAHLGLRAT